VRQRPAFLFKQHPEDREGLATIAVRLVRNEMKMDTMNTGRERQSERAREREREREAASGQTKKSGSVIGKEMIFAVSFRFVLFFFSLGAIRFFFCRTLLLLLLLVVMFIPGRRRRGVEDGQNLVFLQELHALLPILIVCCSFEVAFFWGSVIHS